MKRTHVRYKSRFIGPTYGGLTAISHNFRDAPLQILPKHSMKHSRDGKFNNPVSHIWKCMLLTRYQYCRTREFLNRLPLPQAQYRDATRQQIFSPSGTWRSECLSRTASKFVAGCLFYYRYLAEYHCSISGSIIQSNNEQGQTKRSFHSYSLIANNLVLFFYFVSLFWI